MEIGGGAGGAEGEVIVCCDEGLVLEGGFDDEFAILDEDVLLCAGCLIEFAVASGAVNDMLR